MSIQHYVAANANPVRPDEATHYRHLVTYADHVAALAEAEQRVRDALDAARRIVAGFLDIDPDTGDRRCSDPTCDLCVVAPLIYAALEDLSAGGQS